jgi:hypothetical protein
MYVWIQILHWKFKFARQNKNWNLDDHLKKMNFADVRGAKIENITNSKITYAF